MSKEITSRQEDYAQWYNDLVIKADMAEYSPVRGCMIIKPYGYSIWEKMQATLPTPQPKKQLLRASRCWKYMLILWKIGWRYLLSKAAKPQANALQVHWTLIALKL